MTHKLCNLLHLICSEIPALWKQTPCTDAVKQQSKLCNAWLTSYEQNQHKPESTDPLYKNRIHQSTVQQSTLQNQITSSKVITENSAHIQNSNFKHVKFTREQFCVKWVTMSPLSLLNYQLYSTDSETPDLKCKATVGAYKDIQ